MASWYQHRDGESRETAASVAREETATHGKLDIPTSPVAPPLNRTLESMRKEGGDRVKLLARQLEVALAKTDVDESRGPGTFFQGKPVRPRTSVTVPLRNHSSSGLSDTATCEGARQSTAENSPRQKSPTRPGQCPRAFQSLQKLQEIFADSHTVHVKLWDKMLRNQKSLFRMRSSFSSKLGSEQVVLSRIDHFWKNFETLMKSSYTLETTPGSMLGTVLVAIVEARQACLDVLDFGKRTNHTWRTISKNALMSHLLNTIGKLEKLRDDLMYFVGHRRASRVSSQAFATVRVEGAPEVDTRVEIPLKEQISALVNAPLMLLRERLDPWDPDSTNKLLPGLNKIENTIQSLKLQAYEDWTMLLFEADTFGKAAMDLGRDTELRRKLYTTLFQVFITARSNALAILCEIGLELL